MLISFLAVPFIHGSFSYASCNSWLPDPFFRVYIKNIHLCKHGSDSECFDTEGRFVPEKFEEIFTKVRARATTLLSTMRGSVLCDAPRSVRQDDAQRLDAARAVGVYAGPPRRLLTKES